MGRSGFQDQLLSGGGADLAAPVFSVSTGDFSSSHCPAVHPLQRAGLISTSAP